ncbi:VOC family protein [Tessaracoccus coleopterorum]|uniref:VOC family protein n=1 Tax=Tessaracoccus coleopterorum TaxID=2714950 RepID=UPI0022B23744|nr:VOC family protein [Tessaracoccus coleopterorum]
MKISMMSVFVDDQHAARAFYTDILGFRIRHDIPLGDDFWLTVVSPRSPAAPNCCSSPPAIPQSSRTGMR